MTDHRLALQLVALSRLRVLVGAFLREEMEVADFLPEYRRTLAPFDPYPDQADVLAEKELELLALLVRVSGGWFNEGNDFIPRRENWVYGQHSEPYGWIDAGRYRVAIAALLGEDARNW